MPRPKTKIQAEADNSGVRVLGSIEVDIDSLPIYRSKSQKIKIMDSNQKNVVSAVREDG